jgi:hypothetical protein
MLDARQTAEEREPSAPLLSYSRSLDDGEARDGGQHERGINRTRFRSGTVRSFRNGAFP